MSSKKKSRPTAEERLLLFINACNYGGDLGKSDQLAAEAMIAEAFTATCDGNLPTEDRRLVKLAAAVIAFYREVKRVSTEEVELDFREEEVMNAVLVHLQERAN